MTALFLPELQRSHHSFELPGGTGTFSG